MSNYEAKRGNAVGKEAGEATKDLFTKMKKYFDCFMFVGFNKNNPDDRAFACWGENGIDYMLSVMNASILMANVFEDATPEDVAKGVVEMIEIGKLPAGSEEQKTRSEALMRKFGGIKVPKDAKEFKDGQEK